MENNCNDRQIIELDILQKIDKLNHAAWELRYRESEKAVDLAKEAYQLAMHQLLPSLAMQSKLFIAVAKFLSCSDLLESEKEFTSLQHYFNSLADFRAQIIIADYLSRIDDYYGRYEKGIDRCKHALDQAQINKYYDLESEALTTLGGLYRRLNHLEEALTLYERSLNLRQTLNDKFAEASALNLIARVHAEKNDSKTAMIYYHMALELRVQINDPALPFTYIGMAAVHELNNELNEAENKYIKCLEINKVLQSDKVCEFLSCYGLGKIALKQKQSEKSFTYLTRALELAEKSQIQPNICKTLLALSEVYEMANEMDKAFCFYKRYHRLSDTMANAEIYRLKHIELKHRFDQLEQRNREILDSIEYARRIQAAVLPPGDYIDSALPIRFVLYKPKSIVSGDFYWLNRRAEKTVIVAADCTGHGVPGAFMSMLGVAFLNEIINRSSDLKPDLILNELRDKVKRALRQTGKQQEQQDGMDMVLCIINHQTLQLQFAGAKNSVYLIRNGQLTEFKGDRMPIGVFVVENDFSETVFQLQPHDTLYMASDGYADQMGGEKGRKFMSRNLKELLIKISTLDMPEQKLVLTNTIENWKSFSNAFGNPYEQTDDIMVVGVRIV